MGGDVLAGFGAARCIRRMKRVFQIVGFTVLAVVVAAVTRYSLRRWFPSLYGDRKPSAIVSQAKAPGTAGTGTVPVSGSAPGVNAPERSVTEDQPYPVGHLWNRHGVNTVVMSDGSVLSMAENTEREPRLQRIQRYYVDYEGRRMYYRPHGVSQGAGAKGAPVRPDGVPPVVVSADVPTRSGSGANQSPVAAGASSLPVATPLPSGNSVSSSWEIGPDGVQRLRPSALAGIGVR
jgi:hypothetical protein